jgi:uncharacterized protein with GYD domain
MISRLLSCDIIYPEDPHMARYLIAATYTPEGFAGLAKDKASGRKKAVSDALASIGGKLIDLYFAMGEWDVYVIAECPDNLSAISLSAKVCGTGLVRTNTIPLFTVEEADQIFGKTVAYRAPGA